MMAEVHKLAEARKPKVSKVRSKASPLAIEKALETLQKLGFKVTPPTSQEQVEKRESSLDKLGFSQKPIPLVISNTILKTVLNTTHCINGTIYGPGEITLPDTEVSLFRSLIHQDHLAKTAHYDTAQYNPIPRYYVIKSGNGSDRFNKYSKNEVSETAFSTGNLEPTISTGKFDIAGYNPDIGAENRSF